MSKMLKVVGASWLQTKISSYVLGVLGILAILALFFGQIERIKEDGTFTATVFYSKKTGYSIEYWGQSNELADIQRGVARAYFRMDIDTTGWSILEIETDGSYPDEVQAYAAGIVEGALTWYPIHAHLDNTIRSICEEQEKSCDRLHDALERSVNSWKAYAAQNQHKDPFWHQVFLYYTQMRGVYTGWKHGVERSMNEYDTDISDLYWLNALNDVKEYMSKLNITLEDNELNNLPTLSSAFLKLVDEESEDGKLIKKLFVAHNAAGSYSSMTRILKRYKLNYHQTSSDDALSIPCKSVEFSGYPGSITSQDEFYTVSGEEHRLAVTGTPLNNYNNKLWKDVNITERLPIGPRITAANHLATNVSSWGRILASSNSGTASKQWLVADFNVLNKLTNKPVKIPKITKDDVVTEVSIGGENNDIKHTVVHRINSNANVKGLLWLIEQVPGRTHSADLSDIFHEQGYWATYGLPFFKDIADLTHIKRMEESYGKIFSETDSPRAQIFRQGHVNATTQESIFNLMRQTNFTTENKSATNDTNYVDEKYWSALGIRWDIESNITYGVIDTKIAIGIANDPSVNFAAVSGPPYTPKNTTDTPINRGNLAPIYTDKFDNEPSINGMEIREFVKQYNMEKENVGTPPFHWSDSRFDNVPHDGMPDVWNFEPFMPKWSW